MVEFKVRVDPTKSTVLDATNPDLWGDPTSTNKKIQVGGLEFPKLGLFSFDLPTPPRYGGGRLKTAEFVFNVEKLESSIDNKDITVEKPTLEIYKMKQAGTAGGLDWSGDGDISIVTKAIHQVSGDNSDYASIREDFSGEQYRENNYGWEPMGRHSVVKSDKPYMNKEAVERALDGDLICDSKSTTDETSKTAQELMDAYGTFDPELGEVIFLQSHQTYSNGGGWWRTKRTKADDSKSAKFIKKRAGARHDEGPSNHVLWGQSEVIETELYGDEITPENSIFFMVRGDKEYIDQPKDDGDATVYATAAVRFSTKKKKTGKQSMNMFAYWRAGESNVHHSEIDTRTDETDTPNHVQTAMVAYKNLPFPEPILLNNIYKEQNDKTGNNTSDYSQHVDYPVRLKMDVNFEHLEMAESYPHDADQDYHTHRRGFFVIFSNVKPKSGESLSNYLQNIAPVSDGNDIHSYDTSMASAGKSLAGIFLRNSNLGIRMSDIGGLALSAGTGNDGPYWYNNWWEHESNTVQGNATAHVGGDLNALPDANYNYNMTKMVQDEWYTFNFLFNPTDDDIMINIENMDGEPVHKATKGASSSDHGTAGETLFPIEIYGTGGHNFRDDKDTTGNECDWPAHMSIWVTNYPHNYTASTHDGDDWMIDNSGTDHDTMQSIYVDTIEYIGVNLNHSNATPSENNRGRRGRLNINTGKTVRGKAGAGTYGAHDDDNEWSEMVDPANWTMAFGTESSSDWSGGDPATDTNHRYLLWQDFKHPNKSIPNPIGNQTEGSPTGDGGKNVLAVGYSKYYDWLGRGGTSPVSTQWHNLARTTTADRIGQGHGGYLKLQSTGPSTEEWHKAQFQYFGTGDSDYDNSEDELDYTKGNDFYVNGFTQKGFTKLMIDTNVAMNGEFVPGDVNTSTEAIDLDVGILDDAWDFAHSGYGYEGTNWDVGVEDGDEIYFACFDDTNWGVDAGSLPTGLTQGTKYYANFQSGRKIKVWADPIGFAGDVNLTSTGDTTGNMVMMGGVGVKHSRTESIFSAAKILEVLSPNNIETISNKQDILLKVDTTEPLRSFGDTRYIIFLRDAGRRILLPANDTRDTISPGYQNGAKTELEISIIDETTIKVLNWNGKCDQNSLSLLQDAKENDLRYFNITRAYISPLKYWLWMVGAHEGSDTTKAVYSRSYGSVVLCEQFTDADGTARSAAGVLGATYNESLANFKTVGNIPAPRINTWNHSLSEKPTDTNLDLKDFGFGPIKKEEDGTFSGGMLGKDKIQEDKLNKISLNKIVEVEQYTGGETLNLVVKQPINDVIAKTANISSSITTTYERPHLNAIFEDELPVVENFKVQPSEEDAYNPHFTWEVKGDDLWYGFILVDSKPIENQYHGSAFHVPLNESFSDHYELLDYTYGLKNSNMHNNTGKIVPMGYRYYTTSPCSLENSLQAIHATTANGKNLRDDSTGFQNVATGAVAPDAFRVYDSNYGLAGNTKYFTGDKTGYNYATGSFTLLGTNMWEPSNTTGWTAGSGWAQNAAESGCFRYTKATANNAVLKQTGFTLEAGSMYQITFESHTAGLVMAITDSTGKYGILNSSTKGTLQGGSTSNFYGKMEKNTGDEFDETVRGAFNVDITSSTIQGAVSSSAGVTGDAGYISWNEGTRAGHTEHKIYFTPTTDWVGIAFTASNTSTAATHDINRITINKVQNSSFLSWKSFMGLATDTTDKAIQQTGNTLAGSHTELSVVAHVTPDAWAESNLHSNWICAQGYGSVRGDDGDASNGPGTEVDNTSWGLFIDNEGKINGYAASLSGAYGSVANTSQIYRYIVTSKTVAPTDGTPINVIMTIDTQLLHGNVKLFINGKLEDSTGFLTATYETSGERNSAGWDAQKMSTSGLVGVNRQAGEPIAQPKYTWSQTGHRYYFNIGCMSPSYAIYSNYQTDPPDYTFDRLTGGSSADEYSYTNGNQVVGAFSGKIEEVVIYNSVIYPVEPGLGEFTLTKPLPELTYGKTLNTSTPLTWNAKLFVKDYHNIRGTSPTEVAQSENVSWAKTSFPQHTQNNFTDVT